MRKETRNQEKKKTGGERGLPDRASKLLINKREVHRKLGGGGNVVVEIGPYKGAEKLAERGRSFKGAPLRSEV